MADSETYDNEDRTEPSRRGEDDLCVMIKTWHRESRKHLADWRMESAECYAFVAGNQWSDEDKRMLIDQGRPPVVFNRLAPVIDSVTGMEVNHRNDTVYIPRQVGQQGVNDLLTNAAKFFREEGEAEDEESDAFYDLCVCGIGVTETRPDFEEDPEGLIPVDRIDPLSAWYDPTSHKRNLTDRRYCGYDKEISIEEARAMFPDAEDEDLDASWARPERPDEREPHDATPQLAYNQGDQTGKEGLTRRTVMIVYCEWFEREKYCVGVDPFTGQKAEFTLAQAAKAKKRLALFGIPFDTAELTRKKFYNAFVGGKVLKTGEGRCPQDFTLVFMTGKRDRNTNTWYGIVRAMLDPQRWANKFFSQILHIINSNAKGGVLAERDAFEDVRKAEADWARSDAMIWVRPGAISGGKIQPRAAVTFPVGLDKLMEYAAGSIPDVTGVNLEILGLADREQAGVLEYQRKQSGMTVLATLFDSLRRYRKQQGRAMLYIMVHYIPEGRLIRIDGDDGKQYVPLLKDPNVLKYDVIVDESPTSPNQKESVWSMIMAMMPMLMKAQIQPAMWAEILKYSPLPESSAQKIGQMLTQQGQAQVPPQVQQHIEQLTDQLQQLQKQLQQAEIDKQTLKSGADLKAQEFQFGVQMDQARASHEAMMAQSEMDLKVQIAQKELEIQQARAASEIDIKRAQAAVDMSIDQQRLEIDRQSAKDRAKTTADEAK
jgi:hypothetical protein